MVREFRGPEAMWKRDGERSQTLSVDYAKGIVRKFR